MTERTTHANADQMLDSLLSKLDADKISDSQISGEGLIRELAVVIDCLNFPHWTAEQKSEAKSRAMEYLRSRDREALVSIVRSFPKEAKPAGQRFFAAVFFCLFGLIAIVVTPFHWTLDLIERLFSFFRKTESELETRAQNREPAPTFKALSELSSLMSVQVWPTNQEGSCSCCRSFDHVNAEKIRGSHHLDPGTHCRAHGTTR